MPETPEPLDPMKLFENPAPCGIIRSGASLPARVPPGAARKPRRRSLKPEYLQSCDFRDHLVAAPLKRCAWSIARRYPVHFRDHLVAALG